MAFYGDRGIDSVLRVFYPKYKGTMVEVGAAGPHYLSISKHFRGIGWEVLSIEPNPRFAEEHRKLGHEIIECACGDKNKDSVEFEMATAKISTGKGTSESFSAIKIKEEYKLKSPETYALLNIERIKVDLRRLDTILSQCNINNIDILSIDTEGWELEVLNGLNLKINQPKLIVIENWLKDKRYSYVLTSYGYKLVCWLEPNEIYIKGNIFTNAQILIARIYASILKIKGVSCLITH